MEETKKIEDFQKFIETCEEYELYFTIDEAGSFIWRMTNLVNAGKIPPEQVDGVSQDMLTINSMQGLAAEQTKRFGVDFKITEEYNESAKQNIKKPSEEYWKWLTFWNNWKNGFTDETWDQFTAAIDKQESVVEFLPKTKWND